MLGNPVAGQHKNYLLLTLIVFIFVLKQTELALTQCGEVIYSSFMLNIV